MSEQSGGNGQMDPAAWSQAMARIAEQSQRHAEDDAEDDDLQDDADQAAAVAALDRFAGEYGRGQGLLQRLFAKGESGGGGGVYLWGGVGRGKSLMMDAFFKVSRHRRKRRVHERAEQRTEQRASRAGGDRAATTARDSERVDGSGRFRARGRSRAARAAGRALVSSHARVRNWGAKTNVALIFASIAAVLVVAALVTAFIIDPPALGWVGFAIASAVVLGLGAAATLLLPRMRVSAPTPAAATDRERRRLLVVADAYCSEAGLSNEIQARLEGAVAVHLVVPVRVSHLHFLANDEAEERRDAKETMLIVVGLLERRGISATGSVGSDKPLESMTDALGVFPATHVLLATPPEEESYWLERDLLAKARPLTKLPITQAIVASGEPAASTGRQPAPATAERSISVERPSPADGKERTS